GEGLLGPVPLRPGPVTRRYDRDYRIVEDAGMWVLQALGAEEWQDLYAFSLEPQLLVDYEVANYYVSTHPASPFVKTLTVQLPTPEARYVLRGRELTVVRGEMIPRRTLKGDEDLRTALAETFSLEFPPGTRFRSPTPPDTANP